jgi:hypothetical protein
MLRALWVLAVAGALVYGLYGVQLDGRTVASHLLEVWNSPTVQQKAALVRRTVPKALAEAMPRTWPPWASTEGGDDEGHTEHDRKALDALVERVHKDKKP